MATIIYGISNCDTMKKARAWLDQHDVDYHFHDYKKAGVPEVQLRQWIDKLGWETIINRRGTTWRKLDAAQRDTMDANQAAKVALENPSIIKRPILETSTTLKAGFQAHDWEKVIG